jgi:hypothetical protein
MELGFRSATWVWSLENSLNAVGNERALAFATGGVDGLDQPAFLAVVNKNLVSVCLEPLVWMRNGNGQPRSNFSAPIFLPQNLWLNSFRAALLLWVHSWFQVSLIQSTHQ